MDLLSNPAFWIILTATSELLALSPLKSNSIVQLIIQIIKLLQTKKR